MESRQFGYGIAMVWFVESLVVGCGIAGSLLWNRANIVVEACLLWLWNRGVWFWNRDSLVIES